MRTILRALLVSAMVFSVAPVAFAQNDKQPATAKAVLNLNTATIDQLDDLPGIGRATAQRMMRAYGADQTRARSHPRRDLYCEAINNLTRSCRQISASRKKSVVRRPPSDISLHLATGHVDGKLRVSDAAVRAGFLHALQESLYGRRRAINVVGLPRKGGQER